MLFGSICRLDEVSAEKHVTHRQLCVKNYESNSWSIAMRTLFFKYDLPECWNVVEAPPSKAQWKFIVNKHVNDYWVKRIKSRSILYSSIEYLNADEYYPGNKHWLLQDSVVVRDFPSIHMKLSEQICFMRGSRNFR